jgi:hypothetical protein
MIDDPTAVGEVVRGPPPLHRADRPEAIDLPARLVDRQWYRAGIADCPNCVLTEVCPMDVAPAAKVRSA